MTKSVLGHLNIEIRDTKRSEWYYDRFLGRLGFRRFVRDPSYVAYTNDSLSIWLIRNSSGRISRRPLTGDEEVVAEHLAFRVASAAELASIEADLQRQELYPTFRMEEHPEFRPGYVSATWVDPDNVVLEIYAISTKRPPKHRPARRSHRERTRGRPRQRAAR